MLGSEGRSEQIVRTDQDNALIIRDGFEWPTRAQDTQRFIDELIGLGFPPCPGNVMVSNPQWAKTESEWTQTLNDWVQNLDEQSQMNLAIVLDAQRVSGDAKLLDRMGRALAEEMTASDILLSHFAQPVMRFAVPLTLFGRVKKRKSRASTSKKARYFPLVHGIRALALKYGVRQSNTFKRIQGLVRCGAIQEKLGRNLESALVLFSEYRLRSHLRQLGANKEANQVNNYIEPHRLNRLERDLLREALHVVKEFKDWLALELHIQG